MSRSKKASPSADTSPQAESPQPKYYILDTNILIDYPDIIPNGDNRQLDSPNIDFTGQILVVPTAVVRELSNHKREMNDRGHSCRMVISRLRKLTESVNYTIEDVYSLTAPIHIRQGTQTIMILPVPKNFRSTVAFAPSDEDMDGQIILAALVAQRILCNLPITEEGIKLANSNLAGYDELAEKFDHLNSDEIRSRVILLTNDNGLAIRAFARGVHTARFNYNLPQPYSGRRDLTVPPEMLKQFLLDNYLSRNDFEKFMPREQPLITNEYIIMYPENDAWPGFFDLETDGALYYRNIGRYNKEFEIIEPLRSLTDFPTPIRNAGQAIYADALMDPDISEIICVGPAGCGKTYMATIYAYQACKNHDYLGIDVVPCRVADDGVGYLPGNLDEKLDPNVQPIKKALKNYLLVSKKEYRKAYENLKKYSTPDKDRHNRADDTDSDSEDKNQKSLKARLEDNANLIFENWFGKPIPIAYARGLDFANEIAIYDEFQDQNNGEAKNLITRLGNGGKIIVTGDIEQVHAPYLDRYNNGLTFARNLCKDLEGVAQISFLPSECVRHPLVKAILERLNGITPDNRTSSVTTDDPDITVEIIEE